MAISAIDKELMRYFTRLDETQKRSLLEMIKSFLKAEEPKNAISIEEYNKELDEAMERISRGQFTTLEDLEREMKSW